MSWIIRGVGIDLCEIARMEKAIQNAHFKRRVFVPEEIEYAESKPHPAVHYAACFAGKEAFCKAGGWGFWKTGPHNVWIKRSGKGPILCWNLSIQLLLTQRKVTEAWISVTHESGLAIAFVVLEGEK